MKNHVTKLYSIHLKGLLGLDLLNNNLTSTVAADC
jgi:hypothetical protein